MKLKDINLKNLKLKLKKIKKFKLKNVNIENIILFCLIAIILVISITIIINSLKKKNIENFEIINTEDFFKEELHKPYHDTIRDDGSIFVSIASYRDTECMKTLTDLFDKADNPDIIYVGICHQNKNKNEYCIPSNFKHMDHIRFKDYDYKEALGPTFARYICSHLWEGEQYFMQIDSHSRFIKGWDTTIKNMYKQCESKKSILTHYPPSHSQYERILEKKVKPSHTCKAHFENKFHIISGAVGKKNFEDKPFITSYVSAGLLFGDAKFLHEVPFDPYLPYMFQGEEILLSARLWTNGWDLYNLSEPVITHYYNREKDNQPHFWDDHKRKRWAQIQTKTNKRYYYILQEYKKDQVDPLFLTHVDDYNVGNSRSLKDWFKFTGIDMKNKKVKDHCSKKYNKLMNRWE